MALVKDVPYTPWHGYRARNSFEWDHRMEIRQEYYKIEARKIKEMGGGSSMDSVASYDEACRKVDDRVFERKRKLFGDNPGYAVVYSGGECVLRRGL